MTKEELKKARLTLGLTQAELGLKIGLSREWIGLMERGKQPISWRTEISVLWLLAN